jgi:hypothetical protein
MAPDGIFVRKLSFAGKIFLVKFVTLFEDSAHSLPHGTAGLI